MAAEVSYNVRLELRRYKDGDVTASYCKVLSTHLMGAVVLGTAEISVVTTGCPLRQARNFVSERKI